METLSSVSPTIVLPPNNPHRPFQKHNNLIISNSLTKTKTRQFPIFRQERCIRRWPAADNTSCGFSGRSSSGDIEGEESNKEELERALHLDGSIPGSSDEFVKRVSSRAYDMRRNVQQSLDTTSYDVLEANPWRESSKPVYVLTQKENQICTMKTRRSRSEVERELGQLFSKGGKRRPEFGNKTKQSRSGTEFRMLVEDVREGVLNMTIGIRTVKDVEDKVEENMDQVMEIQGSLNKLIEKVTRDAQAREQLEKRIDERFDRLINLLNDKGYIEMEKQVDAGLYSNTEKPLETFTEAETPIHQVDSERNKWGLLKVVSKDQNEKRYDSRASSVFASTSDCGLPALFDGKYGKIYKNLDGYAVLDSVVVTRVMVWKCVLRWLLDKGKGYVSENMDKSLAEVVGTVRQDFCATWLDELPEYYKLLVVLEVVLVDSCKVLNSGAMAGAIPNHEHSDPLVQEFVKRLLHQDRGLVATGKTLSEDGNQWIGLDISQLVLSVALEREVEGDLLLSDMGQGLAVRTGVIDGAIRFAGSVVVDYPHNSKSRKEYPVLTCGPPSISTAIPIGKGEEGGSSSDDESSGDEDNHSVSISDRHCPRKKMEGKVENIAGKMLGQRLVTKQIGSQDKAVSKTGRNLHQEVTEKFPVMNIKVPVDVFKGISDEEAAKIISLDPKVAYSDGSMKQGKKLDKLVCACDCTVLEFNLLAAETSNDQLVAAIANDNVVFGQKEIFPLRDSSQRKPREFAAAKAYGIYIGLDGGIGFMVNGAGLAMATVDIIKLRTETNAIETHMVFEDENDAAKFCDLLQGGGKGCEGVAEIEASSVFDICQKMRALAVLFRRGGTPPKPESLELNLKAKKRSLEDQDVYGNKTAGQVVNLYPCLECVNKLNGCLRRKKRQTAIFTINPTVNTVPSPWSIGPSPIHLVCISAELPEYYVPSSQKWQRLSWDSLHLSHTYIVPPSQRPNSSVHRRHRSSCLQALAGIVAGINVACPMRAGMQLVGLYGKLFKCPNFTGRAGEVMRNSRANVCTVRALPDWHLMAVLVQHMEGQRDLITHKSVWHLNDKTMKNVYTMYTMFTCWGCCFFGAMKVKILILNRIHIMMEKNIGKMEEMVQGIGCMRRYASFLLLSMHHYNQIRTRSR
ncbi:hypothetical protein IFM89_011848 [Coptis chinensis]|uniref:Uncharacterized protein n=1 Tax=Coptis chinensis TaxID=261450 RepID=A0A835HXL1_9MAGN|nr:hypothetical protein IFM89_011848 [Coptis chinensis]